MNGIMVDRPWLELNLQSRIQVLSWSINRPGFVDPDRIVWREAGNAELPPELDAEVWLERELASRVYVRRRRLSHRARRAFIH